MLYRSLLRPLLFKLPPETAHEFALHALSLGLGTGALRRLAGGRARGERFGELRRFGLSFRNPVGVAAGFDKNGLVAPQLAALGFGFVEVGTVTNLPQPGNPRPRLFRLPLDRALVNRQGFNNEGAASLARRLQKARPDCVLGVNIGKSRAVPVEEAAADYLASFETVRPHADYVTVNVSSPNTPGLRLLQTPEHLAASVAALRRAAQRPILVKLAPDLDVEVLPELVAAVREAGAAGLIATNTTTSRLGLRYPSPLAIEPGGVSGPPVACLSQAVTARLATLAGPDLTIISVGGISTPTDVQARLAAGASLVQVYTSLIYEGPGLVPRLLGR
jgi:dihydroorotate dehydrogenase